MEGRKLGEKYSVGATEPPKRRKKFTPDETFNKYYNGKLVPNTDIEYYYGESLPDKIFEKGREIKSLEYEIIEKEKNSYLDKILPKRINPFEYKRNYNLGEDYSHSFKLVLDQFKIIHEYLIENNLYVQDRNNLIYLIENENFELTIEKNSFSVFLLKYESNTINEILEKIPKIPYEIYKDENKSNIFIENVIDILEQHKKMLTKNKIGNRIHSFIIQIYPNDKIFASLLSDDFYLNFNDDNLIFYYKHPLVKYYLTKYYLDYNLTEKFISDYTQVADDTEVYRHLNQAFSIIKDLIIFNK